MDVINMRGEIMFIFISQFNLFQGIYKYIYVSVQIASLRVYGIEENFKQVFRVVIFKHTEENFMGKKKHRRETV